jgi:hypothetical protein
LGDENVKMVTIGGITSEMNNTYFLYQFLASFFLSLTFYELSFPNVLIRNLFERASITAIFPFNRFARMTWGLFDMKYHNLKHAQFFERKI